MRRYCIIIGKINLFLGKVLQWTILPISAIVMFEVIARYVFNRPTIWAWDVNVQLLAFRINKYAYLFLYAFLLTLSAPVLENLSLLLDYLF